MRLRQRYCAPSSRRCLSFDCTFDLPHSLDWVRVVVCESLLQRQRSHLMLAGGGLGAIPREPPTIPRWCARRGPATPGRRGSAPAEGRRQRRRRSTEPPRCIGRFAPTISRRSMRLIRAGRHVKAASRHGVTPLYLAAGQGNAAMIRRLIAAGADANGTDITGDTVLMAAVRAGSPDAVRALLDGRRAGQYRRTAGRSHRADVGGSRGSVPSSCTLLLARGALARGEDANRRHARGASARRGRRLAWRGHRPRRRAAAGRAAAAPGGMTRAARSRRATAGSRPRVCLIDAGADVNAARCQRHQPAADGDQQQPAHAGRGVAAGTRRRSERRGLVGADAALVGRRRAQPRSRQPHAARTASTAARCST